MAFAADEVAPAPIAVLAAPLAWVPPASGIVAAQRHGTSAIGAVSLPIAVAPPPIALAKLPTARAASEPTPVAVLKKPTAVSPSVLPPTPAELLSPMAVAPAWARWHRRRQRGRLRLPRSPDRRRR